MRVAFDSAPFRYDRAGSQGPSGVAKWSLGALAALASDAPDWELLGVTPGFDAPSLDASNIGPNVSYRQIPIPRRIFHLAQLIGIEPPVEIVTGKIDAVLGNAYIPARSRNAASVPVIYDLSVVKHPEMHPKKRVAYVGGQLSRVVRRASVIVTISECIRQEIAEHYELPAERIAIAPPSWQLAPFPHTPSRNSKAEVPGEYLLFVGTLEPRKNIIGLIQAHKALLARRPDTPRLVLVGGEGWGSTSFARELAAGVAAGSIVRPGYVSDEQLAGLYKGATALVYPSLYEGFGMPIVEAMAAGCPVITSTAAATAEAAGDAALMVDPHDYAQIEDAMERILDDAALRGDLVRKGLVRAQDFTWEKTAAALRAALERAI